MKRELSILIPAYNGNCTEQVRSLCRQAEAIETLCYEIIVADDGSTCQECIEANRIIETIPHCRYIIRGVNQGRAAIRNFLAGQARYEWLLFMDCDMTITDERFISRYLDCPDDFPVVYGGYTVGEAPSGNLRHAYEKAAEAAHTADRRRQRPYHDFHTANFLVHRDVMHSHPFDERFRHYGYEDVRFGKQLRQAGIGIMHIDNPAGFHTFEDNAHFVAKTEEALRTLCAFRSELRGYSTILTAADNIHIGLIKSLIRLWHRLFGPLERRQLCGNRPNLSIFKLYKFGFFLTLISKQQKQ